MQLRYGGFARMTLLLALICLGAQQSARPAFADSVPESIRIQQKAEKAYETAPVVPIDRQNAHRRDLSKDAPASEDQRGQPVLPDLPRHDSDH